MRPTQEFVDQMSEEDLHHQISVLLDQKFYMKLMLHNAILSEERARRNKLKALKAILSDTRKQ